MKDVRGTTNGAPAGLSRIDHDLTLINRTHGSGKCTWQAQILHYLLGCQDMVSMFPTMYIFLIFGHETKRQHRDHGAHNIRRTGLDRDLIAEAL